jgi:pimeloyl-ACP methyl ester carboxylesterase
LRIQRRRRRPTADLDPRHWCGAQHLDQSDADLRGHGASACDKPDFGMEDLVADLERLRERLGISAAHIAGHSLGGMIGPAYALKYSDRVLSLGILSTAAFRTEDDSAKVWAVVRAMEDKGIAQVLETLTQRWFTDAFIAASPDVVQNRLRQVVATDPEVFLNVFRIYAGFEMAPWLHKVTAPSLVLTGEFDGGCNPRLNQLIDAALPNSELVILPGYKHSLLLEAGDIVAAQLVRFIAALGTVDSVSR